MSPMVEYSTRPWGRVIGSRLRDVRHARRYTLDDLARLSGLTKGFLSKIERGVATPAPPTMERICAALDVDLDTLIEPAHGILITDGSPLPQFEGREGVTERVLTPRSERRLRVGVTHFVAGGRVGPQTVSRADVFFIHVQEGLVELCIAGEVHRVESGQSFTWDPRLVHTFHTPVAGRALWATVPASRDVAESVDGPTDRTAL